jgi:hypothetical protein
MRRREFIDLIGREQFAVYLGVFRPMNELEDSNVG